MTTSVAIVGLGSMGKNHLRVISALPDAKVIGVLDHAISQELLNTKLFASLNDLIESKPDYCVIAVPTIAHEEYALELLSNGINLLIEKPLSHNYDSALRILEASQSSTAFGGVGHIERFNSAVVEARERIIDGQLGEIFQISTSRQGPFPSRINDVGVVKDLAKHDIDLVGFLTSSRYLSLSAQSISRAGRVNEDLVSIVGKLENDIVFSHNINWLSPRKQRSIEVIGEKGLFLIDLLSSDLFYFANGKHKNLHREIAHFRGVSQGDTIQYSFERKEPLVVEHENFIRAMRGQDSTTIDFENAAEVVRVADAAIKSSSLQEIVML